MPRALSPLFLTALLAATAGTLAAQTAALSPSPTLPSDTLEANYAPPSAPGPMPDLAPSLPSDTIEAGQPADSFPGESIPGGARGWEVCVRPTNGKALGALENGSEHCVARPPGAGN